MPSDALLEDLVIPNAIKVSSQTGQGLDLLRSEILRLSVEISTQSSQLPSESRIRPLFDST